MVEVSTGRKFERLRLITQEMMMSTEEFKKTNKQTKKQTNKQIRKPGSICEIPKSGTGVFVEL